MKKSREWQGHGGDVLDSVGDIDVIDCRECGFKHIVPIPSASDLDEVYRQEYYSSEKPLYLDRAQEDAEWWDSVYSDRYETFEELLPNGRRRVLDVGSGPGGFLRYGIDRGWQALGIEPSRQAAEHSRSCGLDVIEEFLSPELARQLGSFDAIHASEVLEHLPDPRGMIGLMYGLLEPGGVLCLCVPNDYSPFQGVLRSTCGYPPWWVASPHHINYFDGPSLERLTQSVGFEVVLREGTFPIDMFLLMGDNYVGDDEKGRECHARRKKFELALERGGRNAIKRQMYRSLGEHGVGREVVVYAVRPSCASD